MRRGLVLLACGLGLVGCELTEVSLTAPENTLVAEVYVMLGDGEDRVFAYLHETMGSEGSGNLQDASVEVLADTVGIPLRVVGMEACLAEDIVGTLGGLCLSSVPSDEVGEILAPGDQLSVEINFPDGRELRGTTVVPDDIRWISPATQTCALAPGHTLDLVWTRSPGAWAYFAETLIWDLRRALEPLGYQLESDSVALTGVAVSDADTVIVFPSEFGVFDRFSLDSDLALLLQEGIPQQSKAIVMVAAADRNYVNWVRGGNFNPSGTVRVPSLRGDGIGVFGSIVRRSVLVEGLDPRDFPPGFLNSCIPDL
jgi:hypothetical protein